VVNPKWIAGTLRHGYKGAFEIAATVDYLFAFAATTNAVRHHHFDAVDHAFLESDEVRQFMETHNPSALREIAQRLQEAIDRGLWTPRSNSARARLDASGRLTSHTQPTPAPMTSAPQPHPRRDQRAMTPRPARPLHRPAVRRQPLPVEAWDGERWLGTLTGRTHQQWFFVDLLAVAEDARGQDLGTQLIHEAETHCARAQPHRPLARHLHLPGPGFYAKLGFEEVGRIPDYPPATPATSSPSASTAGLLPKRLPTGLRPNASAPRSPDRSVVVLSLVGGRDHDTQHHRAHDARPSHGVRTVGGRPVEGLDRLGPGPPARLASDEDGGRIRP
jgi:GNAT superfamily N-acetyltransferase